MLSGRMLKIIEFLSCHHQTSYKEIAEELGIKERYIRYDIDKINDYFCLNHFSLIEKKSKGIIIFPKNIDISLLINKDSFIYSVKERSSLILLILLFDNKLLKINRLCKDFQVSRSTIKNDMLYLEQQLSQYHISICYTDSFYLTNYGKNIIYIMNCELSKYVYLLKDEVDNLNSYELYAQMVLKQAYSSVSIKRLIEWIDRILEKNNQLLNDGGYQWYVSNVLLLIWNLIHHKPLPPQVGFDAPSGLNKYYEDIKELEIIVQMDITHYYKGTLIRLLEYIDVNEGVYGLLDPLHIQSIISQLVETMSRNLNIDFGSDDLFMEGLFKHITPLIKRVCTGSIMNHDMLGVIPKEDYYIYNQLIISLKEVDILRTLDSEDEIVYLAVHFIGSMRRLKKSTQKRVLIVCNYGYGSSTMLKETLLSDFQVKVIDTIPSYKLSTYSMLEDVDFIISTLPLKNTYMKKNVVVSPMLNEHDYKKLKELGLKKKEVKINYYTLSDRLHFLDDEQKQKVLKIFQSELGHNETHFPKHIYKVSDLLDERCIQIIKEDMDWKQAILKSSFLLEQQEMVTPGYGKKIIEDIQDIGFYCVTDGYFALFHGKSDEDVYRSGMSLIINRKRMLFDDKKVNIIFCLASKDKKDQIPAMILLMRMVKKTDFLKRIESAVSSFDVLDILSQCEGEVMKG